MISKKGKPFKRSKIKAAVKKAKKRDSRLLLIRQHFKDLPEGDAEAILEARRRLGLPEKRPKRSSHSSLMAHIDLVMRRAGIEPPPNDKSGKKPLRRLKAAVSDDFLRSYEWRRVRYEAIKQHGRRCGCCGRTPDDGVVIHVDHILPRKTHPHLALELQNLQVLCEECNHGKGNWDQTDWRSEQPLNVSEPDCQSSSREG